MSRRLASSKYSALAVLQTKLSFYNAESIPERAVVAEYGGQVAVCGDPKRSQLDGID